jgi:hypothetical protein
LVGRKGFKFEMRINDKSYQQKNIHSNDDCEQTTRTSFKVIKFGSAVDTESFQKEEETRQRSIGESFTNSMENTICLGSGTDQ